MTIHNKSNHVGSIIARILTGVCGAITFGFINRATQTFSGVNGVLALCITFFVFFGLAVVLERYLPGKRSVNPPPAATSIGSGNESDAKQEIEIGTGRATEPGAVVGSHNTAKGDQKIIVR